MKTQEVPEGNQIAVGQLRGVIGQIVNLVGYIDRSYIVTFYGRPVARIVPLEETPPKEAA